MLKRRKMIFGIGGTVALAGCTAENSDDESESQPEGGEDTPTEEDPETESKDETEKEESKEEEEPAEFEFVVTEIPEVVRTEQSFEVRLTAENTGEANGDTSVVATVSNQTKTEQLSVEGGERKEVSFKFDGMTEPGTYSMMLEADDYDRSVAAELDAAKAELDTQVDYNDLMFVGETEEVIVSVKNTGRVDVSTTILLELFSVEDDRNLSLSPGQSEELVFDFEVPDGTRSSVLTIANEGVEEVQTFEIDLAEYSEVVDVTLVSRDDTDCDGFVQSYASPEWEFEISTDVDLGNKESITLDIEFTDGEGRVTGIAVLSPRVPRPGSPSLIITGTDNWPERSCPGWMAIPEGLDEGGSVELVDVSLE